MSEAGKLKHSVQYKCKDRSGLIELFLEYKTNLITVNALLKDFMFLFHGYPIRN